MSTGNHAIPDGLHGVYVSPEEDMAARDKLPAALQLKLAKAPFDIPATDVYSLWLRVQVRVGVAAALDHCSRAIEDLCAAATAAERLERAGG